MGFSDTSPIWHRRCSHATISYRESVYTSSSTGCSTTATSTPFRRNRQFCSASVAHLSPLEHGEMASIHRDNRTSIWFVIFRWAGKQYRRSCESRSKVEARAIKARIEGTIRLLKQGHLELPEDAETGTWIISGGKLNSRPRPDQTHRLGGVCDAYLKDQHGKADTTLVGERIHIGHLQRVIGGNTALDKIDLKNVQAYVAERVKRKHRGRDGCAAAGLYRRESPIGAPADPA